MASKRLANSELASDQLVARTDGRTYERLNHLDNIPHVLKRAGEMNDFERAAA